MKTIYLARHAQSESNTGQKISVNKEINITELGKLQSFELTDWLLENIAHIDGILISTYQRTYQTALPLINKLAIEPVILDELHEFNCLNFANVKDKDFWGVKALVENYWQTLTPTQIDGDDLTTPLDWTAESFAEFVGRVKWVVQHFKALPDGVYVVYTHGIWLSMLIWLALNQPVDSNQAMQNFRQFELAIRPNNCEVFCLKFADDLLAITKVRILQDGDNSAMM